MTAPISCTTATRAAALPSTALALLVRKKYGENFSVSANYYVDMISSASIDVLSSASPYKEQRTQYSVGVDYLRDKTTYSLNYIDSDEPDYKAHTASFGLSHDLFGDLTTINLGYSRGWDVVGEDTGGSISTVGRADPRNYSVGLSQIVTKRLILGLNYDVITDEGYLKSPYRKARFWCRPRLHSQPPSKIRSIRTPAPAMPPRSMRDIFYPIAPSCTAACATSTTPGASARKLPNSAISSRSRGPGHSKQVTATTRRPTRLSIRTSCRAPASRISWPATANFPPSTATRCGWARYDFAHSDWTWIQRGSLNMYYDRIQFQYERLPQQSCPGSPGRPSPWYSYGANVIQFFISIWF